MNKPVNLIYVTDVLCVWAYIAQIRLDEFKQKYGDKVQEALSIDKLSVLMGLAEDMNLPVAKLEAAINDGSAMAALAADMELKEENKLE